MHRFPAFNYCHHIAQTMLLSASQSIRTMRYMICTAGTNKPAYPIMLRAVNALDSCSANGVLRMKHTAAKRPAHSPSKGVPLRRPSTSSTKTTHANTTSTIEGTASAAPAAVKPLFQPTDVEGLYTPPELDPNLEADSRAHR